MKKTLFIITLFSSLSITAQIEMGQIEVCPLVEVIEFQRVEVASVIKPRSGASVIFIGCPVMGSTSLPKSVIEEVSVSTAGISAQYANKEEDVSKFGN